MEIIINNQKKVLDEYNSITVHQLFNLGIIKKQKGIVIAINDNVIAKTEWENKIIYNNDNILIITITQGG